VNRPDPTICAACQEAAEEPVLIDIEDLLEEDEPLLDPTGYIGAGVWEKHIPEAEENLLHPGESIEAMIAGEVREKSDKNHGGFSLASDKRKGGAFATQYLIVTNERVILWARGKFRSSVDAFDFDEIRSVELQQGMRFGAIIFNVGRLENFALANKKEAEYVCNLVRAKCREAKAGSKRQDASPAPASKGSEQFDPVQQLKDLAALRDAGAISEKEFQQTKKAILARIQRR
jgi:hypothetical protein